MDFGSKLKELRVQKKITQSRMAEILDTSKSNISKYESGSVEPNLETLVKISEYFKVPIDYMLKNGISKIDCSSDITDCTEVECDFKIRVRDLIVEQKISKEEFTKKTGFNNDGNQLPSLNDLIKIAETLNVSTDYLLNISDKKRITAEENSLLNAFNRCDDDSKNYLIAKAGVLCVEGIGNENGKYIDDEKKSFPSDTSERGA